MANTLQATAVGATAIAMWSTLALLTTWTGGVPPFQMVAMAFTLASLVGVAVILARGGVRGRRLRWPAKVWLLGVSGLFGYHFFYFLALRQAPVVEANLLNYLWPLLIVLFSGLRPGERLSRYHVAGALSGFAGTIVLLGGGDRLSPSADYLVGYAAALTAAVIWSGYSVLNRRFADVPTDAVAGCCAATAVLAVISHIGLETTVWPAGAGWLAVVLLGLGPVGAAFYVWDYGVKHGDLRVLGTAAYATPLLSTGLLVAFGKAEPTARLALAASLIVGGAVVASTGLRRRPCPDA